MSDSSSSSSAKKESVAKDAADKAKVDFTALHKEMQEELAKNDSSSAMEDDSMMESRKDTGSDYLEESFPEMNASGSKKDFKAMEVMDSDEDKDVVGKVEGGKKDSDKKRARPTSAARTGPAEIILKRSASSELKILAEEVRKGSEKKTGPWVSKLE